MKKEDDKFLTMLKNEIARIFGATQKSPVSEISVSDANIPVAGVWVLPDVCFWAESSW